MRQNVSIQDQQFKTTILIKERDLILNLNRLPSPSPKVCFRPLK